MSHDFALRCCALLWDTILRSLFLLFLAGLTLLCLRRSSAAMRHLVLLLTLVCLFCLPLVSATLPGWHISLWPQSLVALPPPVFSPSISPATPTPGLSAPPIPSAVPSAPIAAPIPLSPPVLLPDFRVSTRPLWSLVGLCLWAMGVCLVLLTVLTGLAAVHRFERCSLPVTTPSLMKLASSSARLLGLLRPVSLRQSVGKDALAVPMTWGWRRPIILLPPGVDQWSEERLRVVLLHELAHIQRRDWLWQMLAHGVCALYWFHPGVWLAARRLRLESERACDDQVLTVGIPASDYAEHLIDVARSLSQANALSRVAMPMAEPPHMEFRLRSILATNRNRRGLRPGIHAVALPLTCAILVALGRVTPTVQAEQQKPEVTTTVAAAPKTVTVAVRGSLKGPVQSVYLEAAILRPAHGQWKEGPREFFEEQDYDKRQQLIKWVFHTSKPGGQKVTLYDADGRSAHTTEYLPDGSVYTTDEMTYDGQGRETQDMGRHSDGTPGAYYKTTYNTATRENITTTYDAHGNVTQRDVDKEDRRGNVVESRGYDSSGQEISHSVVVYGPDGKSLDQYSYLNGTLTSHVMDYYDLKRDTRTVISYEAKLGLTVRTGSLPDRLHAISPLRLMRKQEVIPGPLDKFGNHPRRVTYEWVWRNGRFVPTEAIAWYRTIKYFQ